MTKSFTLTIETTNEAFGDWPGNEVARILRDLANRVDGDSEGMTGTCRDLNGNRVGSWAFEAAEPEGFTVGEHAEICTLQTGGNIVEVVEKFAIVALKNGGFFLIFGDPDSYCSGGVCAPGEDEDAASEFATLEAARDGLKLAQRAMAGG